MTLAATSNRKAAQTAPRLVLIASSLAVLFAQIDTSVVNLALKSIGSDLHAGISAMQWVVDAYNLVYASLLLTGGTLGDLYRTIEVGPLVRHLAPEVIGDAPLR